MEKTTKYDIFKKIEGGNRKVNQDHVEALVKSITKENLLESKPILVNEDMEVIDGQHRLAAAKQLKIPIYYTVGKNLTAVQIATLNSHQKNWQTGDYLDVYSNGLKYPEYVKLKQFAKENDLSNTEALAFFIEESAFTFRDDFIKGEFVFNEDAKMMVSYWRTFLDKVKLFYQNYPSTWHSQAFLRAFCSVLSNPEIVPARFFESMEKYGFLINRRNGRKAYIEMLVNLYNYKKKLPVEI